MKNLLMMMIGLLFATTSVAKQPIVITKKNVNGYTKVYLNDGDTISITEFNLDGEKNGAQKLFDQTGQLRAILNFFKGKKHGTSWYFNEFGVNYLKKEFSLGKCIGTTNKWMATILRKKLI